MKIIAKPNSRGSACSRANLKNRKDDLSLLLESVISVPTPPHALNDCHTCMRLHRPKINTHQNSGINCNSSYNSLFWLSCNKRGKIFFMKSISSFLQAIFSAVFRSGPR